MSSFRKNHYAPENQRAAIETAKLKAKFDTLRRRQEIERRRDELKLQEKELKRLAEREELHGELSAAEAIQKILQESELNDTIALQEATEISMKQTGKQRIFDPKPVGQPQTDKTVRKGINKGNDNEVDEPTVVGMPKQSPDANENIAWEHHLTFPHDLTSSTESPGHHYNSQIWRIQEENAEIQKPQVELLRRMTVPVPRPPVFDGNILEYPKWENAFDALIEDQVVRPNYKLY